MTKVNESKFQAKLIYFIIFVLFLKLLYLIFVSAMYGNFAEFLLGFIILTVIFFVLSAIVNALFGNQYGDSNSVGGTSTVGDRQFQSLVQRYEKMTEEYIEKKQFKKAAYIQLKLLRNPYRAASILKQGYFYNEAGHIFLNKCRRKEEAAECFEMARSYTKAVRLYKELDMNEKVGDIYTKIKDTEKANFHYQIVVDNYTTNYRYVKAALLYRKKMNNPDAANEVLLQGWEENKDAVNCANNFFVSFKDKASLTKALHDFKEKKIHYDNEHNFLKVLALEHNKEIAPKEDIQEMAYEIISKNHKNDEMVSLLRHFINDDTQLQKDIVRHRMNK
jgi:tetratricopeptide (TPR) repeat protein